MFTESWFIIEVSGNPKQGIDIEDVKRRIHRSVIKIDEGAHLEERNFARRNYRYTWTGRPIRIGEVDNTWKRIGEIVRKNIDAWQYDIKIKYVEREG